MAATQDEMIAGLRAERDAALAREAAVAEILDLINRTPADPAPVFQLILEKAHSLCGANLGCLFLYDGTYTRAVAVHGYPEHIAAVLRPPNPPSEPFRAFLRGERLWHIHDVKADTRPMQSALGRTIHEQSDVRTNLLIPLRRDGTLLGALSANRTEVRPYTDAEIALLERFAAQAVIAIENARLLHELRTRTGELARREEELRVTFENMGDGVAMFDAAQRLVAWNRKFQDILGLPDAALVAGQGFSDYIRYLAAHGEYGGDADVEEQVRRVLGIVGQQRVLERIRPNGHTVEIRNNPVAGGGFVLIYADITDRKRAEAEIAAARDAAEEAARTIEAAYRELKIAQANLIQAEKMASLGQLTAGIAHEIKNPLNFVNNFAAISVDLLDELKDAIAPAEAALRQDQREELHEVVATLTGNLQKINQHGKRADSIVKAMLEHSRGASAERRAVDINTLADEALNLAYHGARAQDQSFNITLERDFGDAIAPIEVNSQEITRVLLNLFSNGFYAAARRARGNADDGFRPILRLTTRDAGDAVEIRVRDNGAGIAPDIREKLFQPFFTTKPTGEGTGLGLSITYDIVTKAHGGTIAVDSEVDAFTEFVVALPRRMFATAGAPA